MMEKIDVGTFLGEATKLDRPYRDAGVKKNAKPSAESAGLLSSRFSQDDSGEQVRLGVKQTKSKFGC
jgi:hypothetical protein